MIRRPHSSTRSAFTLVELLMVIMIIGLLISILLPAVFRARNSARRAQAGNDINLLNTGAASFKQEYKFYPPDNFTIPMTKNLNDPGNQVFVQMYPRFVSQLDATNSNIPSTYTNRGKTLSGIQALFYFLTGPSNTGWAVDAPIEPSAGATSKKGPFFESAASLHLTPDAAGLLYNYVDPWKTPYAYFVSVPGGKYNSATQTVKNIDDLTINSTINPIRSTGKYVNSDSVQIVSAGVNKLFGRGNDWTPGAGDYEERGIGGDDVANFYSGKQLGAE